MCIILLQTGGRKNFSFSSSQKLVLLCNAAAILLQNYIFRLLCLLSCFLFSGLLFCSVLTLDERVGAKLLLPELRVDRIHSWVLQQLPDKIFQFLHLRHWRVAHLLLKQTTCHLTQELLLLFYDFKMAPVMESFGQPPSLTMSDNQGVLTSNVIGVKDTALFCSFFPTLIAMQCSKENMFFGGHPLQTNIFLLGSTDMLNIIFYRKAPFCQNTCSLFSVD